MSCETSNDYEDVRVCRIESNTLEKSLEIIYPMASSLIIKHFSIVFNEIYKSISGT